MSLFDSFAAGLDPAVDTATFVAEDVERLLGEAITEAGLCWPGIELDDTVFAKTVGERCGPEGPEALERAALADVYLATACLQDDRRALAILKRTLIEPVVEQLFDADADRQEQVQALVVGLLIGGPRSGPKLELYRGRGALRAWLRITILRTAKNVRRTLARAPRREALSLDLLLDPTKGMDPEFQEIRRTHGEAFEAAFESTIVQLPAVDRRLLRQHHLQGLSLEQLAKVYGIHPVTVSRRLSRVRRDVVRLTRAQLSARLSLSGSELDRTIATILSRVELSFDRLMASREEL